MRLNVSTALVHKTVANKRFTHDHFFAIVASVNMPKKISKRSSKFVVKTSKKSVRKYPKVIWFPRSKTDPREIREVLKIAQTVQTESNDQTFNDKTLGEKMAKIGSINVLGLKGDKYIAAYKGKSIGDVSYITNARMLMRLFRFLGLVTRVKKGEYRITDLGKIYTNFSGDFPSFYEGNSEEEMFLESLANFTFYSVNDDPVYRDAKFRVRPFIWLLYNLSLEPQCIFQLIVTAFASQSESVSEVKRIKSILEGLRNGNTNVAGEWKNVGLDPNDYSCVHNFYDSAKILVYLGNSLGLIDKKANPTYGKKIMGKARHLKQATTFYFVTEKGSKYLEKYLSKTPIYYEKLYEIFGDKNILPATFTLAALNTCLGNKCIKGISEKFLSLTVGDKLQQLIHPFKKAGVEINSEGNSLRSTTAVTFNFWQSIPPEIFYLSEFQSMYKTFLDEFMDDKSNAVKVEKLSFNQHDDVGDVVSSFILDSSKKLEYKIPKMKRDGLDSYVMYEGKEEIYGGTDRFPARISPTNSVLRVNDKIHVDNGKDALDLLVPLNRPDKSLREFIRNNLESLIGNFVAKSDSWEKDQHYTWVRNCFRLFGAEAIYSGSSGMLARADVSISNPFVGGVEAKSPRENRGTVNTKAIRQAVDAKIQVADLYKDKKSLPRVAIAIGRRISALAIKEEKKWASESQPVLLINDIVLYYLSLKTVDLKFVKEDLIKFFVKNRGLVNKEMLSEFLEGILHRNNVDKKEIKRVKHEVELLVPYLTTSD